MRKNVNKTESITPVAYIAKSKQRIKQYGDVVYLKNGDEFQVELFNPTENKVLARIELNAKSIGPGIIIRPGERIFLDRYVTEARKFLFETYKVNGNNKEVQKAIESNGDVVITFFKESMCDNLGDYNGNIFINNAEQMNYTGTYIAPITWNSSNYNSSTLTRSIVDLKMTGNCYTNSTSSVDSKIVNGNTTSTMSFSDLNYDSKKMFPRKMSKEIETGRVEKGSVSDQKFMSDSTKFESLYTWKSEWKLLPESRKEVTIDDLVQYCSVCGRRKKQKEIYCPSCGTKF